MALKMQGCQCGNVHIVYSLCMQVSVLHGLCVFMFAAVCGESGRPQAQQSNGDCSSHEEDPGKRSFILSEFIINI